MPNTVSTWRARYAGEGLAGLRPAFDKAGGVTAGNASGLNDGAAAVMVMTAKKAAALGYQPLAYVRSYAVAAVDPGNIHPDHHALVFHPAAPGVILKPSKNGGFAI